MEDSVGFVVVDVILVAEWVVDESGDPDSAVEVLEDIISDPVEDSIVCGQCVVVDDILEAECGNF